MAKHRTNYYVLDIMLQYTQYYFQQTNEYSKELKTVEANFLTV